MTESRKTIPDLSGLDFEISQTDCSTLGEDTSISVSVSKAGETKKTLLFKYGPAGLDPIPEIAVIDQQTIQISVQKISDLIFRRESWKGLSVEYNIGAIDYPVEQRTPKKD
jgi:hypothetical protein